MAKISVILPIYNVELYLRKCLDNLIAQTLEDIEIICVNDGSTDKSLEILKEYEKLDSRITVVSQENQGQGAARNKGLELATGKYISFVDPDDWIEKNSYELLYNYAEENNAQVVKFNYTAYNNYTGKTKKIDFTKRIKKEYSYDLTKTPYFSWRDLKEGCLWNIDLHVWCYLYSSEFIKSNNIKFAPNKHAEDHLFTNGVILLAPKVFYLDKFLYYYRNRKGSAVNIKSNSNFCVFENISMMKDFLVKHSLYEELEDEFKVYVDKAISWHYVAIPNDSISKFEDIAKNYYDNEEDFYNTVKSIKRRYSFWENIFSLKNEKNKGIKYKVVTILGIRIRLRPRKLA